MLKLVLISIIACVALGADEWPEDSTKNCSQSTKQKAMYGSFTFEPSLTKLPLTWFEVDAVWNDLRFNPISNPKQKGGNYISYTIEVKDGPGGYMGFQIHSKGGQFLFSIWDNGRITGSGENKTAVKAKNMAWPVDMERCKRNCQDCAMKSLKKLAKTGLTTGTQCKLKYDVKVGVPYKIRLEQLSTNATINTADYGGMPEALKELGEVEGKLCGGLWEVTVEDLSINKKMSVGKMLMAGANGGMKRLRTFDEMIGCVKCNAVQHKDTRSGLKIGAADGSIRYPIKMEGLTKAGQSTCKKYSITGSSDDASITFEGGPFVGNPSPYTGKYFPLW